MPAYAFDSGGGAGQLAGTKLTYHGGPLIGNVALHPIFLADTVTQAQIAPALQSQLVGFLNAITTNGYIPTLLGEYSTPTTVIGNGTTTAPNSAVQVASIPYGANRAFDDAVIRAALQAEIAAGRSPAPGANNLYLIFAPPGSAVVALGQDSITGYPGYHSYIPAQDNVHNNYYAVIADPGSPNRNLSGSGLTALQQLTTVASHLLAEAITDPVPFTGWTDTSGREVGDLSVDATYAQDGYQVQYLWSNALAGPAAADADIAVTQLAPPAVDGFNGGPVATFVSRDPTLDASDFTVEVYTVDEAKVRSANWSASVTGGSDGLYVVEATPTQALSLGQLGDPFQGEGLFVEIHDKAHGGPGSGAPSTVRYQPFHVAASAPLTYNADGNGSIHDFLLQLNPDTGNLELFDNGQLVFTQPLARTTGINISTAPTADSSLTIDYSGGVFDKPINFEGGSGTGPHLLTIQGGVFSSISDTLSGRGSGTLALTSNTGSFNIAYTGVTEAQLLTSSQSALTFQLPTGADAARLRDGGGADDDVSQLDSLGGSFTPTSFTNPAKALNVKFGGNDALTVTGLDSKYAGALFLDDGGGNATVVLDSELRLGTANVPGDLTVTAGTITVNHSIETTHGGAVTFNNSGRLTLAGGISSSGAVTQKGSGAVALESNISAPLAAISFASAVALAGAPVLTATAVTFAGTVDDGALGVATLLVNGNLSLQRSVGASAALQSLRVSGSSTLGASVVTTGSQDYGGAVTLSGDTALTTVAGGRVSFAGTVDGPYALSISGGAAAFGAAVGSAAPLASLTTSTPSGILLGTTITTRGAQEFNNSVALLASSTLISTGGGSVRFAADVSGAFGLAVHTAGLTSFAGTTGLDRLSTDGAGSTAIAGAVMTGKDQVYGDAVSLLADLSLESSTGDIVFARTVDGPYHLSVTTAGKAAFGGAVGATTPLASLTTMATSLGAPVTTTGAQTYGSVDLTGHTILTAGGDSEVRFGGTVDGNFALTVNSAGATTFDGAAGTSVPLASLFTDAAGSTNLFAPIKTHSTQTYQDAVTVGGDVTLTSTSSGNITFGASVDSGSLTVKTLGTTLFAAAVGAIAPLYQLKVASAGSTDIAASVIQVVAEQEYGGPVRLLGDASLTGLNIDFRSSLDGAFALAADLHPNGAISFRDVGPSTPLASVSVGPYGVTRLGRLVRTSGDQSFANAVELGFDTTLESSGGGAVQLYLVDGGYALDVNTSGETRFQAVGAVTPLARLDTDAPGSTILAGTLNTSGDQTFNDPVKVAADTNLMSLAGAITFASSVDGNPLLSSSLSLTSADGVTFASNIGAGAPLASLSVAGGPAEIAASTVVAVADQLYTSVVSFTADSVTLSADTVTFASRVDLGSAELHVAGSLEFAATATLSVELAAASSPITVTGDALVNGAGLDLRLATGFIPEIGAEVSLINMAGAGSLSGDFSGSHDGGQLVIGAMTFGLNYHGGADDRDAVLEALFGVPDRIAFQSQPQSGVAGTPLPRFSVAVQDAEGGILPLQTGNISLSVVAGPGTLSGNPVVTAVNGVAIFTNVILEKAGTYLLSALMPGLASAVSTSFTVGAAAPTDLAFVVQPADVAADQLLPEIKVVVRDAFGNLAAGSLPVTLSANGPGGIGSGATTVPVVNGIASFTGLTLPKAGAYTLTASGAGLPLASSGTFNVRAAAASQVVFTAGPGDVDAGAALPDIAVQVMDQLGNPVSGAAVSLDANGPGSLMGGSASAVTGSTGSASFTGLTLERSGLYRLYASLPAQTAAASNSFMVHALVPTQIGLAAAPGSAVAGQALADLRVEVQDVFGNVVSGNPLVTLSVNGPGAPIAGPTSVAAVNGVALFEGLTLSRAGDYTLGFSTEGLQSFTTGSFAVEPGAASRFVFETSPPDVVAGQPLPAFRVHVSDAFGNAIDGATATLSADGAGDFAAGTTTAQTTAGVATFSGLILNHAGDYTLSAAVAGSSGSSAAFNVAPAAPDRLIVETAWPASMTAGETLPDLVVAVVDVFGNPVSDEHTVELRMAGQGDGSSSAVTSGGSATFAGLKLERAGSYTFEVATDGLTGPSLPVVVVPAAPAQLVFTAGAPAGTHVAGQALADIAVDVLDAFGNPVTAAEATLSLSGPGGPVAGNLTAPLRDGTATFSGLVLQKAGAYQVTVRVGPASATSGEFQVAPAQASRLVFAPLPAGVQPDQALRDLTVTVVDDFGNVASSAAPITIIASGPAAPSAGNLTAQPVDGVATFSGLVLPAAGSYVFFASASGLSAGVSGTLLVMAPPPSLPVQGGAPAGPGSPSPAPPPPSAVPPVTAPPVSKPALLRFQQRAVRARAGKAMPVVRLRVLDASGRPVKAGVVVRIRISSGRLKGLLQKRTDRNGYVSFSGLKVARPGRFLLYATSAGVRRAAAVRVTVA